MSESTLQEVLRPLRFLEGISEDELRQIASVAQLAEYPAGRTLFREGETLACIFLVVDGSVALELPVPGHGYKRIHTVGPGELLGWSPLLSQLPMTATARALAPTRVITLDAGQMLALCHHDPRALALAKQLDATRLQLLDVYRHERPVVAGDNGGAKP